MNLRRYLREISVAASYAVLLLVLAIFCPAFFRSEFRDTWVTAAPLLVLAIGMTLLILAKQIDISIGSQFSIAAVMAALLAKAGVPMPLVVAATVALGAVLGAINGALVAGLGLPSIVATLAMMVVLRESLRLTSQGATFSDLPVHFQWFGASQGTGQVLIVTCAGAIFVAMAVLMRHCAAGRAVYAVGSDAEAARLAGIRPRRVVVGVFIAMGALTGLAAVLQSVRFAQVEWNTGAGLELETIAAVVVGGTAISGGRGTLLGTLCGVALLVTIGPALTFLRVESHWQTAVHGLIILLAVASDAFQGKKS